MLAFAWVTASVWIAAWLARPFANRHGFSSVMAPTLFLGCVLAGLLPFGGESFRQRVAVREVLQAAAMLVACYLAAVAYLAPTIHSVGAVTYVAILVAATAEELVFRWALPRRLAGFRGGRESGGAWFAAVCVSQLCFAFAHLLPQVALGRFSGFHEFVRLFTAGLLFAQLTQWSGICFSSLVHAIMNLDLVVVRIHAVLVSESAPPILAVICLALLALQCVPSGRALRDDRVLRSSP